jgi:molybdenum cofactor sulfurtransferase
MVLIDAAKGCTTEPPNLTLYPADFVVCSFYKVIHGQLFCFRKPCPRHVTNCYLLANLQIFGYPTGLGALIVKNGRQQAVMMFSYYDDISFLLFSIQ